MLKRTKSPRSFLLIPTLLLAASLPAAALADSTITVAADGSGNFTRLQDALASIPTSNSSPITINIKPGTYAMSSISDQFKIASPDITLNGLGASPADVVLTGNYIANASPNDRFAHATTVVTGNDFTAKNITFANTSGDNTGQALALYAKADRLSFLNCNFLGWQDTLRTEFGRQYFQNCYVEGDVDFIYGHATAYFDHSTLHLKSNGYVTAPALLEPANDYRSKGFVFNDCTITGPTGSTGIGYLGRPWTAGGLSVFLNTKIGPVINSAGWSGNLAGSTFAEFNSMDLAGAPLDVSHRAAGSLQLTSAQLPTYSLTNWLSGPDHWTPASVPEPSTLALALPAFTWWISRRRR
ncbi:MAG: pectinesterase family protein [Phycisphaerae bacterium]